jgi:ribonuclease R
LAKRAGPGRNQRDGGGRSRSGQPRARRKERQVGVRGKAEISKGRRTRSASQPDTTAQDARREAIVREILSTGVEGQTVVAEERQGERWRVECLGEPVEVGARILFLPLVPEDARRGEMLRLVDAARINWVCTLRRAPAGLQLTPFGGLAAPELQLSEKDSKGADDGMRVVVVPVEPNRKPRAKRNPSERRRGPVARKSVRVVEVLGRPYEPESDHRALVWKHRLTTQFSRRGRLEMEGIAEALSADELARRVDLRHLPFVTIDPASARDHDDAVYAERRLPQAVNLVDASGTPQPVRSRMSEMTWSRRLWVAIADVSHFVKEGGWIDAEARRRGNSFYFPDRSIPMLPERLSSDLCSLRPDVDRLAMVVELRIGAGGQVADALFHEAVIRSRAGLSYEDAARWLSDENKSKAEPEPEWADSLGCLAEVAEALSRSRFQAGAIALELPEIEIVVDEEGHPVDARVRERNRAHLLIEEAMLAANRAVARALDRVQRSTIHRVHPPPSGQKLAALSMLLDRLGVAVEGDLAEPGVLASILDGVKGMPMEERMNVAALRSMSQARYEADSRGHYALRFDHYLHFTSPIRRYADLEVHRALKGMLREDEPKREGDEKLGGVAARLAIWLSGRERVAAEVERDAEALACCAIMSGREGEQFDARVTGATQYGLFVRLETPAVSGLVPMRVLEGSWIHDPEDDALFGERSGMRIGSGDRISVRLLEVDADRARIAFRLLEGQGGRRPHR